MNPEEITMQKQMEDMQEEIQALRTEFDELKSSTTIPLSIYQAFKARFGL